MSVLRLLAIQFAIVLVPVVSYAASITIAWDPNREPHVAGYKVFVAAGTGATTTIDVGNTTRYAFQNAAPGVTYRFSVAAYDAKGTMGRRSTSLEARAGSAPAAPVLASPSGTITTSTPTFTWRPVAGATSYLLWVNNDGTDGKIQMTYAASQIGCGAGSGACAVPSPVPLANGSSRWNIRPLSSSGEGPWSTGLDFTVSSSGRTPPPPVATRLTNGGFESNLTGWTATGNHDVITAPAFAEVSEGRKAVVFNGGQRTPNAVLSRTVATTAGQTYTLTFEVGAFSALNRDEQRLQVVAKGSASLLSRTVSVFAPGTGTRYVSQTFTFVADSASTTLTFSDRSTRTLNVDLLLDNVRVLAVPR